MLTAFGFACLACTRVHPSQTPLDPSVLDMGTTTTHEPCKHTRTARHTIHSSIHGPATNNDQQRPTNHHPPHHHPHPHTHLPPPPNHATHRTPCTRHSRRTLHFTLHATRHKEFPNTHTSTDTRTHAHKHQHTETHGHRHGDTRDATTKQGEEEARERKREKIEWACRRRGRWEEKLWTGEKKNQTSFSCFGRETRGLVLNMSIMQAFSVVHVIFSGLESLLVHVRFLFH